LLAMLQENYQGEKLFSILGIKRKPRKNPAKREPEATKRKREMVRKKF